MDSLSDFLVSVSLTRFVLSYINNDYVYRFFLIISNPFLDVFINLHFSIIFPFPFLLINVFNLHIYLFLKEQKLRFLIIAQKSEEKILRFFVSWLRAKNMTYNFLLLNVEEIDLILIPLGLTFDVWWSIFRVHCIFDDELVYSFNLLFINLIISETGFQLQGFT